LFWTKGHQNHSDSPGRSPTGEICRAVQGDFHSGPNYGGRPHLRAVFSFGAVLYEMLAGSRAFSGGSTAQVLSAVLHDEPRRLDAPAAVEHIVRRCLARQPEQRFQSMADVRVALEQLRAKPAEPRPSIAVRPFSTLSGDKENEYSSDGLTEEIINVLAQILGLNVTACTSSFAFRSKEQDVRKIAETLDVRTILEGLLSKLTNNALGIVDHCDRRMLGHRYRVIQRATVRLTAQLRIFTVTPMRQVRRRNRSLTFADNQVLFLSRCPSPRICRKQFWSSSY
jgi:TolB-like protein